MAQTQRLLEVLASTQSDSLTLLEGEPVTLLRGGASHPITRQPLSIAHWRSMIAEMVAPVLLAAFEGGAPVEATLTLGANTYAVALTSDGTARRAVVRLAGTGAAQAAAPAPLPPAPDDVATHPMPGMVAGEPWNSTVDLDARAAMDELLRLQVERSASDLHLRAGAPPILREHGSITSLSDRPEIGAERLLAMLQSIMPERNRREFHEVHDTDFAYELEGAGRFRANVLRDRHGPAAVFRCIPTKIVTADELRLSPELQALCSLSKGLVLVTGPTGSGKSTTLCALIDLVNRSRKDHIVTIEDPIEFVHDSKGCLITQRQVGEHTTSFKQALRAALREDPDVVLVGELRDLETVGIAIETAETGHLVFATMHTSTAASTVDRIIDQFPADRQEQIRVMLSESLKGVISQTLCRRVGGGRVAAMEILLATPALSNLIRESKTFQIPSVMQTSRRLGMVTMNDAMMDLVERGQVEPKEAYLKAVDKSGIAAALKARGHDTSFIEGETPSAGMATTRTDPGTGNRTAQTKPGYAAKR
jgi:twitching motility protein PilT